MRLHSIELAPHRYINHAGSNQSIGAQIQTLLNLISLSARASRASSLRARCRARGSRALCMH